MKKTTFLPAPDRRRSDWFLYTLVALACVGLVLIAIQSFAGCKSLPSVIATPTRWEPALRIAMATARERVPGLPEPQVNWIADDECGIGAPSLRWRDACTTGLSFGCELYVTLREPPSDSALASELRHCAEWVTRDSDGGPPIDGAALEQAIRTALEAHGL